MSAEAGGPGDIWSRVAMSVFRLNGLLVEAGEGITRPLGETSARWQVIGRVAFEAKTVAQLAREIGHARQSVQRVADQLVRDGLVEYRQHPSDGRTQLVELTPLGEQTLRSIYRRQLAWSERILAQLDTDHLEGLVRELNRVSEAVGQELQPPEPNKEGKR
ncbi:MAG TPA: MarR family transcriptional regulator [Propionicimonas sp.]